MNIEIERKFLVDASLWKPGDEGTKMVQAYLAAEACTVRVRIAGDKSYITIKSHAKGISRQEYEYEIPVADAREMIKLSPWNPVEKTRYVQIVGGKKWEIDVFEGANAGLIVAEIELESEDEEFELPAWVRAEVSRDRGYSNLALAKNHPIA